MKFVVEVDRIFVDVITDVLVVQSNRFHLSVVLDIFLFLLRMKYYATTGKHSGCYVCKFCFFNRAHK